MRLNSSKTQRITVRDSLGEGKNLSQERLFDKTKLNTGLNGVGTAIATDYAMQFKT
ncbi:hypothetical protein [Acinetobacter sp. IK40]|jgi:hypothetical protein|uniref:hypothetical protein n=1 Tax=Acinetobacter sp. IK40 TaxID=2928897 RepID=UPI002D1E4E21|nr:hypothetical protein [Acinetobacter sp. IK40]MEB3792056.1 hypothetical protein [Acinetobacter sp. IK40]